MASLLGQFFTRINGSQEDIASEGMVYVLQSSKYARDSICKLINSYTGFDFQDINYITQFIGEKKERPDISGINKNGSEVIIMEAKFWASLTENQPVEYLNRLKPNSVLIFICPSLRIISLNNEIQVKLKESKTNFINKGNAFFIEEKKHIIIFDWKIILENIKDTLVNHNERVLISDIDQIIGFCEIIDNYSFLPIMNCDLSPSIPKRINSYCDLLDKIVEKLKSNIEYIIKGSRATPQKYGYTIYFSTERYGLALEINMKMWELYADTPFWYTVKYGGNTWDQPQELKIRLKEISLKYGFNIYQNTNNDLSIAIYPKTNEVEDIVINDIVNKIMMIMNDLV